MSAQQCPCCGQPIPGPLTRLRNARGWTLRELSQRSGVAFGQLNRLEREQCVPRLDTARKIAAAFGVTVDEVFPPFPILTPLGEHEAERMLS